jgi:multicomponent Na+:H+ antiporter subunit E
VSNVLSGTAVAIALLVAFPLGAVEHVDHRVRPLALVRLAAYFGVDVLRSSLLVARDILRGPSVVRTGIVACPLRVDADGLTTFLANALALSPGTMPIEVTSGPATIHLHVLRMEDPDLIRARVGRLEELAVAALGSDADLRRIRAEGAAP